MSMPASVSRRRTTTSGGGSQFVLIEMREWLTPLRIVRLETTDAESSGTAAVSVRRPGHATPTTPFLDPESRYFHSLFAVCDSPPRPSSERTSHPVSDDVAGLLV